MLYTALYSLQDIRISGLMVLASKNGLNGYIFYSVAALLVIGSYLLGSVNFAIYLSKAAYRKDIRDFGSKNAGTTNMMRTFGTKAAVLVLLGDVMKAVISVTVSLLLCGIDVAYIAGIACILGHCYPIYYKFKGGKGIATVAGMILAIEPIVFLICIVIFIAVVATTKMISAASIMAALFFPLILNMIHRSTGGISTIMAVCAVFLAFFILFKHRENIIRIINGQENKFSFKKSVKPESEKQKNGAETDPDDSKKD